MAEATKRREAGSARRTCYERQMAQGAAVGERQRNGSTGGRAAVLVTKSLCCSRRCWRILVSKKLAASYLFHRRC
eukprot:3299003-Pleurochrysis_carterae.AAC.1